MRKQNNLKPVRTRALHVLDAKGAILGRLATRAATLLRGKHKVDFELNEDCGDYVEVINAKDIKVTGNKLHDKIYYSHTNYPGGLRSIALGDLLNKSPESVIERAVKGMLPKNRLQTLWLRRLKVYPAKNKS